MWYLREFFRRQSLNARFTLKKNSDFRRLYSKGKNAVTAYLVVYIRRNKLDRNRTGFTVSAKLGNAVTRNRIRRQMREIYRQNSVRMKTGYDIIVVARSRCVNGDFHKMEDAFIAACDKLGIFSEGENAE